MAIILQMTIPDPPTSIMLCNFEILKTECARSAILLVEIQKMGAQLITHPCALGSLTPAHSHSWLSRGPRDDLDAQLPNKNSGINFPNCNQK